MCARIKIIYSLISGMFKLYNTIPIIILACSFVNPKRADAMAEDYKNMLVRLKARRLKHINRLTTLHGKFRP